MPRSTEVGSYLLLIAVVCMSLLFVSLEWNHIEASNEQLKNLEDNVLIKELKRQIEERDVCELLITCLFTLFKTLINQLTADPNVKQVQESLEEIRSRVSKQDTIEKELASLEKRIQNINECPSDTKKCDCPSCPDSDCPTCSDSASSSDPIVFLFSTNHFDNSDISSYARMGRTGSRTHDPREEVTTSSL